MLDAYDQQRNAAYLKKQMEDEQERLKKQKDAQQKGWQQELDNQINERNLRNKIEKDWIGYLIKEDLMKKIINAVFIENVAFAKEFMLRVFWFQEKNMHH